MRTLRFGSETFPALTGVRAIAAYLVFFHHYTPSVLVVASPVHDFLAEGHVGVTLFYVLSGFLITYNYWDRAKGLARTFWVQYLTRRIARIYPLYLFLLALTFLLPVLLWDEAPPNAATVFLNVTLLKGFFVLFNFSGIAPSWSLTVEESFYLLAPFIFVLVRRFGFVAAQLVLYTVGMALFFVGARSGFYGFFGNVKFVALYTFFGRSFEFLAGMALARFFASHSKRRNGTRWPLLTSVGVLGSALVVYSLSLLRVGGEFGLFHPFGIALNNIVLPLFVCFLLWGLASEASAIGRVLSSPVFVFLGRSSYSFYLVHYGILALLIRSHLTIQNEILRLAVLFILANAVSALLFIVVEHPANQVIRQNAERFLLPTSAAAAERSAHVLRKYRIGWCAVAVTVFFAWCVVHFDWLRPAANTISQPAQASMRGGPALGRLLSAKTDFGVVTSHVGDVGGLTYRVAGQPIASRAFIFAHARSMVEYYISPLGCATFEFSTGLDDAGGADLGSVVYVVRGDGRTLFESATVRALTPPRRYSVNVAGVQRLQLIVTDGGDGIASDEAYWIDPVLR